MPIATESLIPGTANVPSAPQLPEVSTALVTSNAHFVDGINRVWALAGRMRFDEAEAQLQALLSAPDCFVDNADRAAKALCEFARLHADDHDPTVYRWLRERGISLWYRWGAGATSGGDGNARAVVIRAAEQVFVELDRAGRT